MAQLGDTIVNGTLRVNGEVLASTATTTSNGLMSAADKTKLDNISFAYNSTNKTLTITT